MSPAQGYEINDDLGSSVSASQTPPPARCELRRQ